MLKKNALSIMIGGLVLLVLMLSMFMVYNAEPHTPKRDAKLEQKLLETDDVNKASRLAQYAGIVVRGPWPEAEQYIKKDPVAAYEYAAVALKHRWEDGEPIIATHAKASVLYARDVIGGRWEEAESTIMKSIWDSYAYSISVMNYRWVEMEPKFEENPFIWTNYLNHFNSNRMWE